MSKAHEQTIREIVESSYRWFCDQRHEYENPILSFGQNVQDSCIEDGYSGEDAQWARDWFCRVAERDNGSID